MELRQAILLIGPTGAGKTPLGESLERHGLCGLRCAHFDFGSRMRRIVDADEAATGLHREEIEFLSSVLDSGALLEDRHFPIAERILRAFIADRHLGGTDLLVLNGLPRHAGQARGIGEMLDVRLVVELTCTADTVLRRIRTNSGGDRHNRSDDDVESVRRRLAIFRERTAPLLDFYRTHGVPILSLEVHAETKADDLRHLLGERVVGLRTAGGGHTDA